MIDMKEMTVEERLDIARSVKPASPSYQYTIELMKEQGFWPYDDKNDGYVAPPEARDPQPAPKEIADMMKMGGNPFIVNGVLDYDRINMGYEAALEAHNKVLNEAASAEYDSDGNPVESLETPAPAPVLETTADEHPVGNSVAHFMPVIAAAAAPNVPGQMEPNRFVTPDIGMTSIAEVAANEGMIDVTDAFTTPMHLEEVPATPYMPMYGSQAVNPQAYAEWYARQQAAMMAAAAQQQQQVPMQPQQRAPIQPPPASVPLQVEAPKKTPKPKKNGADSDVQVGSSPTTVIPNRRDVPDLVQAAAQEAKAPVQHEVPEQLTSCFPGNANFYSDRKTSYLAQIEQIALSCGCQVLFSPHVGANGRYDGLMSCAVYDAAGKTLNPYKSFTIDMGRIIDRRHKVFPVYPVDGKVLEQVFPFEVKLKGGTAPKGGGSRLDEALFHDIFVGGVAAINRPPMYTKEMMMLNRYVDYSSISYPKTDTATRNHVRDDILLDCLKADRRVFEKIQAQAPNSRFAAIEKYDPEQDKLVLSNVGVPAFYNGPVLPVTPVTLTLTPGKAEWTIG